jgi:DNA phosphorothioation-associated putative methyltransferase
MDDSSPNREIERHRAAMIRTDLSLPVRLALETGLFTPETTFFDYGCGRGGDVERIAQQGYSAAGWDPYYRPDIPLTPADIVNLGYIINVIEHPPERREALLKAWELAGQVLIVSAQVLISRQGSGQVAYGDGIITCRNTFQKYYDQQELKSYIDQVLDVDAIPVSLGIYFIFRDEQAKENFRASYFYSRTTTPRIRINSKKFEDYEELLIPLMDFVTKRGRLPIKREVSFEREIQEEFINFKRAFQVILQVTDRDDWETIAQKRREDIIVYLALSYFRSGPQFRKQTQAVQNDIKSLFGTLRLADEIAKSMLLNLKEPRAIANCCQRSKIGKILPTALYVHISALEKLDPLLRIYEGCASSTIGRPRNTNLIKLHTNKPQISYLYYPEFDTDPHPCLSTSVRVELQDLQVDYRDYRSSMNPPILHRKETFVTPDYPQYEKFAKLTKQEEDWGLLDDIHSIGTRKGWQKCLEDNCAEIRNHRVYWRKDADPYRIKLLRSARRQREK